MPRGVKRNALELERDQANDRLRDAQRWFERARLELEHAIQAAAIAGERVRFAQALKERNK
ncbi:MAG TPA: hypothetical protein VJ011_03890 [Steroidobacteraceae bacterium]|nr:hypothetical protein [Steroidobacteraceae bacterium]